MHNALGWLDDGVIGHICKEIEAEQKYQNQMMFRDFAKSKCKQAKNKKFKNNIRKIRR